MLQPQNQSSTPLFKLWRCRWQTQTHGYAPRLVLNRHCRHDFELAQAGRVAQAKVKAVADAVWSRLSGNFSKDVLHAQHVSAFVQIIRAGKASKGEDAAPCLSVCQRKWTEDTIAHQRAGF